ncbi:histidine kinase [Bacteroidales bacterium OttesenSCG-928-I21]|nr:histidine kinase [Bacteroidales bacterium OttesenSCG-928-I21]
MQSPFLNKNFSVIYFSICGFTVVIQFLVLYLLVKQNPLSAAMQSLFSNLAFATLGVGLWYLVKYQKTDKDKYQILVKAIIVGFVFVMCWMAIVLIFGKFLHRISAGAISFEWNFFSQIIVGFLFYIILTLIFHVMMLVSKYTEKTISEERLQSLLTETKLNALKAYINPHFLFNSLNSVNALIVSNPEKARTMLVNLSEYFRYNLKQKDVSFVSFENELENALVYFEIEKLRFGDRVSINCNVDEKAKNIMLPVMTLQPLFENIIKHAVSESFETILINLNTQCNGKYLDIILTNNYDSDSVSKTGTGIGLATNFERFNLIYNRKDLIKVSKSNGLFKVFIKIPINFTESYENINN